MTTTDDPTLEDRVRSEHAITRQLLQELRTQRKEIDATVRELVAADKTQRRLIAVFDRAKKPKSES